MRSFLTAVIVLGLAVATAGPVSAGRIFGDITFGGKPLPAGAVVRVTQPGSSGIADTTTVDKYGSFKLMVKAEGKCKLTVIHEKQPAEIEVFSNKVATRYDLVLEKKDGKPSLRRK